MDSDKAHDWRKIENNRHCKEILENEPQPRYFVDACFERILGDDACMMPYKERNDTVKTMIHWGQRKLLMSEIEFLTLIGLNNLAGSLVVYAGAAPGTHIEYLSQLFPEPVFMLVDPAPFSVRKSEKIMINNQNFTDKMAQQIREQNKGRAIYFISDIRTADHDKQSARVVEDRIRWDMEAQMRWHELLGAKRSMLKLRLPWDDKISEYLDGDIYLPVWGPQTTTECRLITNPSRPLARAAYDHKKYESQMMFFNNVTRHSLYRHDVVGEGLDHCYDCTAEIFILNEYLRMRSPHLAPEDIATEISKMSRSISRSMGVRRTLLDDNPDPEERRKNIARRQHGKDGVPAYERGQRDGQDSKSQGTFRTRGGKHRPVKPFQGEGSHGFGWETARKKWQEQVKELEDHHPDDRDTQPRFSARCWSDDCCQFKMDDYL